MITSRRNVVSAGMALGIGIFVAAGMVATTGQYVPGTGGGVSAPSGGGTTNTVPVWTSSSGLGNSSITDNGTTVTTAEPIVVSELDATTATTAACTTALTDLAIGATTTVLRINSTSGGCVLLGIVAPTRSRLLWIVNSGSTPLQINHESSSELTAANRIDMPIGSNWQLSYIGAVGYNNSLMLYYDLPTARWIGMNFPYNAFPAAISTVGLTSSGGLTVSSGNTAFNGTGVVKTGASAVTLASCGTSPACATNSQCDNMQGRVTTGAVNTGCTVTFASPPATVVPSCICSTENPDTTFKCVPSNGTLVVTYATNSGNTFDYMCLWH